MEKNTTPIGAQVLPFNEIQTVKDYPYGRTVRTVKTFALQMHKDGRTRSVEQTVNPANGKLNKPKYSTFTQWGFMYMYKEHETHHIKYGWLDMGSYEETNSFIAWMVRHADELELSPQQTICVLSRLALGIAIAVQWTAAKEGVVKELCSPTVTALAHGINLAEQGTRVDWSAIPALPVEVIRMEETQFKQANPDHSFFVTTKRVVL